MSDLTFAHFHNALRIMRSIDLDELQAVGIFRGAKQKPDADNPGAAFTWAAWCSFRDDPYSYFIRCDDETAQKIWQIIERRQ